ncbi:hypothetical protein IFR05_011007 [Cadophora sp. M221]|nr:hypothetical protein IFR05_011007 [Cadophora sp. M221]
MSSSRRKELYTNGLKPEAPDSNLFVYCPNCKSTVSVYGLERVERSERFRKADLINHECHMGWRRRKDSKIIFCGYNLYDACVDAKQYAPHEAWVDAQREGQYQSSKSEERRKAEAVARTQNKNMNKPPGPDEPTTTWVLPDPILDIPTDREAMVKCPTCKSLVLVADLADKRLGYNYRCFKSDRYNRPCGADLKSRAQDTQEWLKELDRMEEWIPDAPERKY